MRNYLPSLAILSGVYFLHLWGMDGAYVRLRWLDIASHFLVSFGIALWLGGLIYSLLPGMRAKKTIIIALTFLIGFAWEWLEVQYNITGHPLWSYEYYFDTGKDFIVDIAGATAGAWVVAWTRSVRKVPPLEVRAVKIQNQ
jgi:hypothetical protein